MPLLSRLKQLPHLFNHRLYVCLFLSEDCASGFFYLTHFVWLPATFRNAVTRDSSEGVLLFSSLLGQASFRLPRPPSPHRLYLQTDMGG